MAEMKMTSIDLEPSEVALVIGEEDGSMTVRVVPARELPEGAADVPEPYEIAVALAMRLLNDPDFHDDMLEWYESQEDQEEDGDESAEDEEEDDGKRR
ncbi:MAG TPA: hypothetical protein VE650_06565 [Acetobacteraceae bacterium]|nr:hypothetical protein [Acetobacteraceae bacterium]